MNHPLRLPGRGRRFASLALGLGVIAGLVLAPCPSGATEATPGKHRPAPLPDTLDGGGAGDGVYGRYGGPFALAVGPGLEVAPSSGAVRPTAVATLRFYQSIGLGLAYAQAVTSSDPLERTLAATIVLEPLFLLRWSSDAEWGRAFWDLTLDSLSVSAGAVLVEPRGGSLGDSAGFRLGLGAGIPLLCRANGPWLRFGGRMDTAGEIAGSFFANLEWQWFFVNRTPE